MNVGDYIRTNDGKIGKIGNITRYAPTDNYCMIMCENFEDYENNIIKSSLNIIDLIEVGDYVNGNRVEYIDDCKGAMREFYYIFENPEHDVGHYEEEIQSVVTKEQFEAMKYEIK